MKNIIAVKEEDLPIINKCLANGCDCRIQLTGTGYRIVSDKVVVLKRGDVEKESKEK